MAATTTAPTISENEGQVPDSLQITSLQIQPPTLQNLKDFLAQSVAKYGGNYYQLEKVIQCESGWDNTAKNPNSAASGIAQFMPGTFAGYCGGDYKDPFAQIHCLVIAWSGGHQDWWSSSKGCWGQLNN